MDRPGPGQLVDRRARLLDAVAGELPNTPDNLELWIRSPQKIHPRTAMPALGLDDQQARDVVAYLYTLR